MVATGKRWSHSAACYEAVETLSLDIQVVLMNGFHINNKFDYQIYFCCCSKYIIPGDSLREQAWGVLLFMCVRRVSGQISKKTRSS